MAKTWKHFDKKAGYVDWPEGADPNPQSIFMPKFLNQFVAWLRYFAVAGGLATGRPIPRWVVDRKSIIQYAAFWNNLVFVPSAKWLANSPVDFGSSETPFAGDDGYARPLLDLPLFDEPEWVEYGDCIHPGAPFEVVTEHIKMCRARIDAASAWVLSDSPWSVPSSSAAADISAPFPGITADMKNHEWTLYDSNPTVWVDRGVSDSEWVIDYFVSRGATYWQHGQSYATDATVSAPNESLDLGAMAYIGLHSWDGASGTPLPGAATDAHAIFVDSVEIGTSSVNAGDFGEVGTPPGLSPAAVFAKQSLFPVYVAPDELPESFRPSANLP
jgi:hypothetical protein